MSRLTRRMQILLDDDRHARLERIASKEGRTVAAIVREAIDARVGSEDQGRRSAAMRELLQEPMPAEHEPDWEVSKNEMLDAMGGLPNEGPA